MGGTFFSGDGSGSHLPQHCRDLPWSDCAALRTLVVVVRQRVLIVVVAHCSSGRGRAYVVAQEVVRTEQAHDEGGAAKWRVCRKGVPRGKREVRWLTTGVFWSPLQVFSPRPQPIHCLAFSKTRGMSSLNVQLPTVRRRTNTARFSLLLHIAFRIVPLRVQDQN